MVREKILEIGAYTENTKGNFSVGLLADTTIINQQNSLFNTSFAEENQAHTSPLLVRKNKYLIYLLDISRNARHLQCLDSTLIISPLVCLLIYSIFLLSVPVTTISYSNREQTVGLTAFCFSCNQQNMCIFKIIYHLHLGLFLSHL